MKYCVIKNTTKVIDGSDNLEDVMLINAENAGYTSDEVEILTEEEYQERKSLEPMHPRKPTQEEIILQKLIDLLPASVIAAGIDEQYQSALAELHLN